MSARARTWWGVPKIVLHGWDKAFVLTFGGLSIGQALLDPVGGDVEEGGQCVGADAQLMPTAVGRPVDAWSSNACSRSSVRASGVWRPTPIACSRVRSWPGCRAPAAGDRCVDRSDEVGVDRAPG